MGQNTGTVTVYGENVRENGICYSILELCRDSGKDIGNFYLGFGDKV